MNKKTSNVYVNSGVGFGNLLLLLFIALKLTGYIQWSWWWVLSPIWIGFSIVLLIVLAVGGAIIIQAFLEVKKHDAES